MLRLVQTLHKLLLLQLEHVVLRGHGIVHHLDAFPIKLRLRSILRVILSHFIPHPAEKAFFRYFLANPHLCLNLLRRVIHMHSLLIVSVGLASAT